MRYRFINVSFAVSALILLLILFLRVGRGLDLTDEMQYYGEIHGLISSGRLFSNDLFIQQTVYILLFPMFRVYHWLFGFSGLVAFSRLLLAALSIAVFLYANRKLIELELSQPIAATTALSLTFAVVSHNIFSPSYNTISQVMWIVFALKFLEWKQDNMLSWAAIPVIVGFAHPPSAITMTMLVAGRLLLDRDYRKFTEYLCLLAGGALIAALILLWFASPEEYIAALGFSSGFSVGSAFLSSRFQQIIMGLIIAAFVTCWFSRRLFNWLHFPWLANLALVAAIGLFAGGYAGAAYNVHVVYALACTSALAYLWLLSNASTAGVEPDTRINWLVAMLLAYAATLAATSSNGITQSTGTFMVGLPLLLGFAANSARSGGSDKHLIRGCLCLLVVLFVVQWSRYPYRDSSWLQADNETPAVPEFAFIGLSSERAAFVNSMRDELLASAKGKRALIVSTVPGLYFVLNARPETCMLFMHSVTSTRSENALTNCLRSRQPEVVIDISLGENSTYKDPRIKKVAREYYSTLGLSCHGGLVDFSPVTTFAGTGVGPDSPELQYTLCQ